MGSARFYSVLAALLFTAVCAYIGAAVFPHMDTALPETRDITVTDTVETPARLHGIVLRTERCIPQLPAAQNGRRLSPTEASVGGGQASERGGIYFESCDGFEYLSPRDADSVTPEGLDALMEKVPESTGDSARLVEGYAWYCAVFVDGECPDGACRVLFDGTEYPVRALVISHSSDDSGRTAALLRLTCGGEYLSMRYVDGVIY